MLKVSAHPFEKKKRSDLDMYLCGSKVCVCVCLCDKYTEYMLTYGDKIHIISEFVA